MKIPGPLQSVGAPLRAARAATQGRPYNYVSAGSPADIFIRSGDPQDDENFVVIGRFLYHEDAKALRIAKFLAVRPRMPILKPGKSSGR